MATSTPPTGAPNALQFSRAHALGVSHGHWWAVTAAPETWEVARDARNRAHPVPHSRRWDTIQESAEDASRRAAFDGRWRGDSPEQIRAASDEVARAVWAGCATHADAIRESDDAHRDDPWVGPRGPTDLMACYAIAESRDPDGWGGVDYAVGPDGVLRHTTCTGRTSWEVEPDGAVTIWRHQPLGDTYGDPEAHPVAWATVSPDGAVMIEPGPGDIRDMRRISECLRALGLERPSRRALLLASPASLAGEVSDLERRREEAACRPDPSGAGYPPEYWERHVAPLRAALGVLRAGASGRAAQDAARAAYLS